MRKFLVGAVALLGLSAVNTARAECGIERDAALVTVMGGSAAAIALAGAGLETTLIGTTVTAGFAGPALGILAFGLYNNYCKTGSMFKAAPVTFVQVETAAGYRVAAADMSQITPKPKFAAVSTDLGAQRRAELVAAFNTPAYDQYASAK